MLHQKARETEIENLFTRAPIGVGEECFARTAHH